MFFFSLTAVKVCIRAAPAMQCCICHAVLHLLCSAAPAMNANGECCLKFKSTAALYTLLIMITVASRNRPSFRLPLLSTFFSKEYNIQTIVIKNMLIWYIGYLSN